MFILTVIEDMRVTIQTLHTNPEDTEKAYRAQIKYFINQGAGLIKGSKKEFVSGRNTMATAGLYIPRDGYDDPTSILIHVRQMYLSV